MKKLFSLILAILMLTSIASVSLADVNGTVVLGLVSTWDNLIPYTNNTYYSSLVLSLLYDKLVYVDAQGTVEPRAAESWALSEDGLVLTFQLNPNAKFHDGETVTAGDWVYSLELLGTAGAGTVFTDQSLLSVLEGTDETGVITDAENFGAKALDDTTLQLTFKSPIALESFLKSSSYFLTVLPEHLLKDLDATDIAAWDFWNAPVGSGPAAFQALSQDGTELTLTRFADYPLGDANWDTLVIRQSAASALSSALLTGELDVVYTPVGNDEAIAMQTLPGAEELTFTLTDNLIYVYVMAVNNTIVSDVRIRQALNYAVDRETIALFLTGDYVSTIGEPMQLYLTTDNAAYPEDIVYEYNPEKATALLEAAKADGYDGKFVLAAPVAGQRAEMAVIIGQYLENAGFEVELVTIDAATMMADLRAGADGTYDAGIIVYGISQDPLVRKDIYTTGAVTVLALEDATYDELLANVNAAEGIARQEAISDYLHYIDAQQAAVWLAGKRQCYVFNSRLGDITSGLIAIANRNLDVWNWVLSK